MSTADPGAAEMPMPPTGTTETNDESGLVEVGGETAVAADGPAADVVEAPAPTPKVDDPNAPTKSLRNIIGGVRAGDTVYLPTDRLVPSEVSVRDWLLPENIAAIDGIAATIKIESTDRRDHIRDPLLVLPSTRGGTLEMDTGETRWRAVLKLEGKEYAPGLKVAAVVTPGQILLPCMAANPDRTKAQRCADTITQVGRPPNAIEQARQFQRMSDEGMTQAEIAEAIQKPGGQTYVSQTMALNKADPKVLGALRDGRLATTTIVNAYRDYPETATETLLEEVAKVEQRDKAAAKRGGVAPRRPSRVTARAVAEASGRKAGTPAAPKLAHKPREHTPANFNALLLGVKHEARYSKDAETRTNMNKILVRIGQPEEPCLLDENGNELPNALEILENHNRPAQRKRSNAKTA